MNKEDKDLLLKDLCGRLPYGVKIQIIGLGSIEDLYSVGKFKDRDELSINGGYYIDMVRPYLRPMTSMTDEERMFFHQNSATVPVLVDTYRVTYKKFYAYRASLIDWFLINHFDWRGLIEQGLALEAPEGMYNN